MGSFTLSYDLFSKDNEYVYTDYDIPYETFFTCPEDVICSIDKTTGTIYQASHFDTVTLSVSPTRPYQEGETMAIELRAKSTSPCVTELKAKFEYIVGKRGVTYEIEEPEISENNLYGKVAYHTVIVSFLGRLMTNVVWYSLLFIIVGVSVSYDIIAPHFIKEDEDES